MGTANRVILFVFAGRQPNIELQLPLVRRILDENPNVEYHVWNFARNDSDREFVKTIQGERITVFNGNTSGYNSPIPTGIGFQFGANEHNAAYRYYSDPAFSEHLFVKIDDDIVFLETARFAAFIDAVDTHRGSALIANLINNGACTPVNPGIWAGFQKLGIPLLDIHIGSEYPEMAHTYFFDHHDEMLGAPIELIPSEDWLSINAVGYDWPTLRTVLETIGTPHPYALAGRCMIGWGTRYGDEGVFQNLPRMIVKGFTAAHLGYGPQNPSGEQLDRWRDNYRRIGQEYLQTAVKDEHYELPSSLSPVSCGHIGIRGEFSLDPIYPVIIFCFAGTKANMALQVPLIKQILEEHPQVEFHIWNQAKNTQDGAYVRSIQGERITVRDDFYNPGNWARWFEIYQYYAEPQFQNHIFIKIDEDIVFLETGRFSDFLHTIIANPGAVVSAKLVNNGACTLTEPGLCQQFESLDIPLLDVHLSSKYAELSHNWALDNFDDMIDQPVEAIATQEWLSINLIGYQYQTGQKIARKLGMAVPFSITIAGRTFAPGTPLGDEGAANELPRRILNGFLAAHLYFAPQRKEVPENDPMWSRIRHRYASAGQQYLETHKWTPPPPSLSSHTPKEPTWQGDWPNKLAPIT